MSTYWCCLYTRDGAETLKETLLSITGQSIQPAFIVVIDDNSVDETNETLQEMSRIFKAMHIIKTNSKTRDIRRAPWLLNLGLEYAKTLPQTKYMMISGDDCVYPNDYASELIVQMNLDDKIAVASGDWGLSSTLTSEKMPAGAGRFVRTIFMDSVGSYYPVAYGWEAWLILKALERGWTIRNFENIHFSHKRPYRPGNVYGWGRGMYSLGYPPYFVLIRFLRNLITSRKTGSTTVMTSVAMLSGYVSSLLTRNKCLMLQDDALKKFVKRRCASRTAHFLIRNTSD